MDTVRFTASLFGSGAGSRIGPTAACLLITIAALHNKRRAFDVDLMCQLGVSPSGLCRSRQTAIDSGWLKYTPLPYGSGLHEVIEAERAEMPRDALPQPRRTKTKLSQFRQLLRTHSDRAESRGLQSTLTLNEWRTLLESTAWACAMCGSREWIEVEHMVPISRGGGHTVDNVCPMCSVCNAEKRTKTPLEWIWGRA